LFKKVILAGRDDKPEAIKLADAVRRKLLELGLEVDLEDRVACKLGFDGKPVEELEGDLAVVIGGDGTILRVVHSLRENVPIFPVRLGRVGFLAEAEGWEAVESLSRIVSGDFIVEECFTLGNDKGLPEALNEVMVGAEIPLKTVEVEVYVDDWCIARDRVDAILVSTTTGATGYSLSAGGCLIDSRVEAILIVPVCPLSTNFKPYIVPSDSQVRVRALSGDMVVVLVDGQFVKRFKPPLEVVVKKGRRVVRFIRFGMNFYERVKRRLFQSSI